MSNWVSKDFFSGFACIFMFWLLATASYAQEDEIIAGGKGKYTKYCASCHGNAAKGDGSLAQMLLVKPADLTQLSKRNGGQFPFWRVYRMIDGREEVRGHGSREMPMWGFIFQIEEGATQAPYQEDVVRGRIWQLVYFLESIQEK
jgi:mono/diheme cytochrome c family protein